MKRIKPQVRTEPGKSFSFRALAPEKATADARTGRAPVYTLPAPVELLRKFASGKPLRRPARGGKLPPPK
jgi:hypothetical protein